MTGPRGPLYVAAAVAAAALVVAGAWWGSVSGLPGDGQEVTTPAAIPVATAPPPVAASAPSSPAAPPPAAPTPSAAPTPTQRGPRMGCAAQAEPHGTDEPSAWHPAPLPWSAPCARPPGGPAWRSPTSMAAASPHGVPIRLIARPELLPGGEPAHPDSEPPADTLDQARALPQAWARWLEADQAAELAADPALIAHVAGYVGTEQYTRHYTRVATAHEAAGAYDCQSLALDAALLAIDLRPDSAHTISWRRGGGAACRTGPSPDAQLIGTAACAGELRLRYHAWSLIEGEWIMSRVFVAARRHADEMRSFANKQSPAFAALVWRIGHYIDRIEAEYNASGRPCD